MKKLLCIALSTVMLATSLASCANVKPSSRITSSAGLESYAEFLESRLGDRLPDSVYLGLPDESADMTEFENDGYITRASEGDLVIYGKTAAGVDRAVRDYVKNGNPDTYEKTYHEGYRVKKLTVNGRDISDFCIYLPENSDECNTIASTELQKYIEKTCGARLDITDNPNVSPAIRLVIGDLETYGNEGFSIEVKDDTLTITGGRYRGCVYGVYDLLEQDIGWRFYPDPYGQVKEYLYENETVNIDGSADRFECSSIKYRALYGGSGSYQNNKDNTIYKSKSNSISSSRFPGSYGLSNVACHGLQNYYSFSEYNFNETHTQPCYTDESILEQIYEQTVSMVNKRLKSGSIPGYDFNDVDVSQPDTGSFCKCQNCLNMLKKEGSNSGAVLRMTNRAAELVDECLTEAGYPDADVLVLMLAYNGTDRPPKITKPRDNVKISYCFYIGENGMVCGNHHLTDELCPANRKYCADYTTWSEMTENMDVWYYPFNCYQITYQNPYFNVLYKDIQYLLDTKTDGVFYHSGGADGARLHPLIVYLGGLLLWDNGMTEAEYYEHMREWFFLNYGDAGDIVYEMTLMMEYASDEARCWTGFWTHSKDKLSVDYIHRNYKKFIELIDLSLTLCDSAEQEKSTEMYSSGPLYAITAYLYRDMYVNGTEAQREELKEIYTRMYNVYRKYNINIFYNFEISDYAPDTLDFDVSPFDWFIHKS